MSPSRDDPDGENEPRGERSHGAEPALASAPGDTRSAPSAAGPSGAADGKAPTGAAAARQREIDAAEPRNLLVVVLYQIVLRVGWIFKTESIVMPAFLDHIGGTPLLRGCLPVFNRFGFSVPPVLFARRLKLMRQKRLALVVGTLGMGSIFLLLAALCAVDGGGRAAWLPWAFLTLYALFFVVTGMNQLAAHTLQGKLIRAEHRGRLMALATATGAPAAIVAALLLLGPWLERPDRGFSLIFAFAGGMFALAALLGFALREPPDDYREPSTRPAQLLGAAWKVVHRDSNVRRLALVAALYSTTFMLFPHYQALGRERLGLDLGNILLWIVVQNAAAGTFALLAGPAADGRGNRIVLSTCVLLSALTPLLATGLAIGDPAIGRRLFWLVFVPIGLTPVSLRTLTNYTLEISDLPEHPRYVSTISLCVAAPTMLLAPLVGLAVGQIGFEPVFLGGAALIALAGLLATGLQEPRHHVRVALDEVGAGTAD